MPDKAERLLQRPGDSPPPLGLTRADAYAELLASFGIEHVPSRNEVQRGVGRTEATRVQDTSQPRRAG